MKHAENIHLPSDRRFGLLFTLVLAGLGILGPFKGWTTFAITVCFVLSLIIGILTLAAPQQLTPLNKAWFCLGELLGRIVSPFVLGVLFFGVITPLAIMTRLFGRDELKLKRPKGLSYWNDRLPPGPAADSFHHEF